MFLVRRCAQKSWFSYGWVIIVFILSLWAEEPAGISPLGLMDILEDGWTQLWQGEMLESSISTQGRLRKTDPAHPQACWITTPSFLNASPIESTCFSILRQFYSLVTSHLSSDLPPRRGLCQGHIGPAAWRYRGFPEAGWDSRDSSHLLDGLAISQEKVCRNEKVNSMWLLYGFPSPPIFSFSLVAQHPWDVINMIFHLNTEQSGCWIGVLSLHERKFEINRPQPQKVGDWFHFLILCSLFMSFPTLKGD